jgi:hypothetical protein
MEVFRRHLTEQVVEADLLWSRLHRESGGTDLERHGVALFDVNLLRDSERDAQCQAIAPFLNRGGHVSVLRLPTWLVNLEGLNHEH